MLEIEYTENFDEIDKIADKLLSEHDAENGIEYNFKQFSFIAKENGEAIGYLTGFSYYAEVTINNLVVLKKYRNKGTGRKLVKRVVEHFSGKGFNNVNLVTNEFQSPQFYEKCGFTLEFKRRNVENPKLTKYFFIKYF